MIRRRDWDAATYDRVSDIQATWAREVLDRLPLEGGERVLDAGCGSGRVTEMLLERLPRGHVVAVDADRSMVEHARERLDPARTTVLQSDLLELELDEPVDAVFSNAVLHWIPSHDRLFQRLHDVLRPGGVLVAQYGGEGNVARFTAVADAVAAQEPYAEHFTGWSEQWNFTAPADAHRWLEQAGFAEVEAWLEPRPMLPAEPVAYIATVCLGPYLGWLPEALRTPFVDAVAERLGEPLEIDYVRLNVSARRGGAA